MAEHILIVEDEEKLREIMALFLQAEGYSVDAVADGESALASFAEKSADLVILDVNLPGISGFDVCRRLRQSSDVPILFLTALGDEDHQMLGYHLGADDYIVKPFKVAILTIKVKRILMRTQGGTPHRGPMVELDSDARVCRVNGAEVSLTPMEFQLMEEFTKNPGRVLTREYLLDTIWGYDFMGETRVVDTMVKNLRKKLGTAAELVKTVISVGYKYEEQT